MSTSAHTCADAGWSRKSTMQRAPTPCAAHACSAKSGWPLPLLSMPAYSVAEGDVEAAISTMNTRPCGPPGGGEEKPDGVSTGNNTNCFPVPGNVVYSSFGFGSTPRLIGLDFAVTSPASANCACGSAARPEISSVVSKNGLPVVNSRNACALPGEAYTASVSAKSAADCPPPVLCRTMRAFDQVPVRCGSLTSTAIFNFCDAPAASENCVGVAVIFAFAVAPCTETVQAPPPDMSVTVRTKLHCPKQDSLSMPGRLSAAGLPPCDGSWARKSAPLSGRYKPASAAAAGCTRPAPASSGVAGVTPSCRRTLPASAVPSSADSICAGPQVGCAATSSAAAPATFGEAIDVPVMNASPFDW